MTTNEQLEYSAQREIDALQAENERLRAENTGLTGQKAILKAELNKMTDNALNYKRWLEEKEAAIAAALAVDVTEDWDALGRVREILEKA